MIGLQKSLLRLGATCVVCWAISAADKSGVSPNSISLPKGPGSIEGLGENFQPTLNTGTAKYSVALKLPPGTAGHAPQISFVYDGGAANGPLGFGWDLPISFVERQWDKGVPLYPSDDLLTLGDDWSSRTNAFINDSKEELIPTSGGFSFSKNEGAFVRYQKTNDYWLAWQPDGTRLTFGKTPAARISEGDKVFKWLLEAETDTHGNTILYSYSTFSGEQNLNQKYLSAISYGAGKPPWTNFHFVSFLYEDRPDWFEDGRAGFLVRTGKRLSSIVIGTQGPTLANHSKGDFNNDGTSDQLDRRYDLGYLPYAGTNTHWSLLARVTLIGSDGVTALPSSAFDYAVTNPPEVLSAADHIFGGTNEPSAVMDTAFVDFIDLNGDGFPDILQTFSGEQPHRAYINQGQSASRAIQWSDAVEITGDAQARSVNLASQTKDICHLSDIDGDGLADLVFKSVVNTVYYFRNAGHAHWEQRQAMSDQNDSPPSPFATDEVRTADLDLDKRIDIVQSLEGQGFKVWFNVGTNTFSRGIPVTGSNAFSLLDKQVQLQDFNGDRVPDLARIQASDILVMAGIGYGRFVAPRSVPIPDYTLPQEQVSQTKLQDITGDGLPDLVLERAVPGELWYWINLGNYTLSSRKIITDMPTAVSAHAVIRWADINGNGSTDLIYADSEADSTNVPRLQTVDFGELFNPVTPPNLLTSIKNGIGRVTLIGYKPSTGFALADSEAGHPWPDPMPFPVQVVSAVTNLDSLGHSYITKFAYHDGYYDPVEKQFRGFARVEQIDVGDPSAPTLVTRSYFDTGRANEVMKGKLLRLTAEQEDGKAFWDEITDWITPPKTLYVSTNNDAVLSVHYVHPVHKEKSILELGHGTPRKLESEFTYDNFGNQTINADYGIVEGTNRLAFQDERVTTTEYAINTNLWLLHNPSRIEIKGLTNGVISRKEFFYDDGTFSANNFGQVTLGNLTLTREWIDPSSSNYFVPSSRTKYDSYGNPTNIFDPLAIVMNGIPDLTKGHGRALAYETNFNTYPVEETIYIGDGSDPLTFHASYDPAFGTVTSSRDFNNVETTYGYDPLARLINIVRPGDTPAFPTVEYTYALAVPSDTTSLINYIETRQLDKSPPSNVAADVSPLTSNSPLAPQPSALNPDARRQYYFISRQFVDGLGRQLMTKTEAEPAPGSTTPRVAVSGAVLFNQREKPSTLLNPFFSTLDSSNPQSAIRNPQLILDSLLSFENLESPGWSGQFHDTGNLVTLGLTNAPITRTEYDAALREIKSINQDGTFRTTTYEPLLTRSYDENDTDTNSVHFNTPMVHYNDGLGRLIQVDEVTRLNDDGTPFANPKAAPVAWTTRYEYDLNDQLTRIIDSQQNEKYFHYDGLKRKTWMNDPDRGMMDFIYDPASNLIETKDAKAQRILYTYDGANRILTENYLDAKPAPPWRPSPLVTADMSRLTSEIRNPQSAIRNSTTDPIDVLYHYDTPVPNLNQGDTTTATAQFTQGKLSWVEDLSGEEHTSYDSRGRVASVVKRIPDPMLLAHAQNSNPQSAIRNPQLLVSYCTRFQYDSLDRVTRLHYPDLDYVDYQFNDRNLLSRIIGGPSGSILTNLTYQPSGAQAHITYGNGILTDYTYDPRLRLKELFTRRPGSANFQSAGPQASSLPPDSNRISPFGLRTSELVHFGYDFDPVSNIRTIHDLRPATDVPEGDKRRNTQILNYDDLYRLTRAQYSFSLRKVLPSPPPGGEGKGEVAQYSNDGEINYRYDRIGNMLAQTSTIEHFEKGLSVTDLGQMDSGGIKGRFNRKGRNASDPPGPHALSSIRNPQSAIRNRDYPYDPNGNMEEIDGLKCVWDFKDRLIAVENTEMHADYTYDYTDRRIIKFVTPKSAQSHSAFRIPQSTFVLYPNKYFEVREHDAPTKYVWNGNTRVAHVTGSLSDNIRVQRLRLYPGWNLCSVAVGGARLLPSFEISNFKSSIDAAFQWNSSTRNWLAVSLNAPIPADSVLWLRSTTNIALSLTGTYSDPTNRTVASGGDFLPSPGLEVWSLQSSIFDLRSAILQIYDAISGQWLSSPPAPKPAEANLVIAPGQALFTRREVSPDLPNPELRIRYYHQDHLGSTSRTTDTSGRDLEQNSFFPFGTQRDNTGSSESREWYTFTQKERDKESAITYFEAREEDATLSRFLSPDALLSARPTHRLEDPRALNPYAYALNNPVNRLDPTGMSDIDTDSALREQIRNNEVDPAHRKQGFNESAYRDTAKEKNPTIGVGLNINTHRKELRTLGYDADKLIAGTQTISKKNAESLFEKDVKRAIGQARTLFKNFDKLPIDAQRVLVDMAFNMGKGDGNKSGLGGFKQLKTAVEENEYFDAALAMTDSRWCAQVKTRCTSLVQQMYLSQAEEGKQPNHLSLKVLIFLSK